MPDPPDLHVSELLPEFVNGSLSAGEADRVREHLETCSACRADWQAWMLIAGAVRSAPRPVDREPAPVAAVAALTTPVSGPAPRLDRSPGGRSRRRLVPLFAAACLLLGLVAVAVQLAGYDLPGLDRSRPKKAPPFAAPSFASPAVGGCLTDLESGRWGQYVVPPPSQGGGVPTASPVVDSAVIPEGEATRFEFRGGTPSYVGIQHYQILPATAFSAESEQFILSLQWSFAPAAGADPTAGIQSITFGFSGWFSRSAGETPATTVFRSEAAIQWAPVVNAVPGDPLFRLWDGSAWRPLDAYGGGLTQRLEPHITHRLELRFSINRLTGQVTYTRLTSDGVVHIFSGASFAPVEAAGAAPMWTLSLEMDSTRDVLPYSVTLRDVSVCTPEDRAARSGPSDQ